jgi:hypothetical protein
MKLTHRILAGAIVALLPLSGAMACTITAWSANTGTLVADDPDANNATNTPETGHAKRVSGACGLAPGSGVASFVTDNSPADGVYRARFYVFTGIATGAPRVFEAFTADAGAGTSVFSVTYDSAGGDLDFTAAGTTMPSIPVVANKWYSVEFFHNTGSALTATVSGNNNAVVDAAPLTSTSAGPVAGTVQSVRLGNTNGAALTFAGTPAANNAFGFSFDEFDSTRSATTPIGRLCRGDANGNANAALGDNDLNVADATTIVAERLGQAIAVGQPDANEDGIVNVADATAVVAMRLANKKCN